MIYTAETSVGLEANGKEVADLPAKLVDAAESDVCCGLLLVDGIDVA